jgi:N-acetylglutamate synthase-like GNAT family acetyltransferase
MLLSRGLQVLKPVLRPARNSDLPRVRELLPACGLPAVEENDQFGDAYVLAEQSGDLVGVAGMEIHGDAGLLRSVAVAPVARSQGLGDALVRDRIRWGMDRDVSAIYLLTTTAETYFAKHGFVAVDRGDAPQSIKASKEFKDICPSSAILMLFTRGGVR